MIRRSGESTVPGLLAQVDAAHRKPLWAGAEQAAEAVVEEARDPYQLSLYEKAG